MKLGMITTNYDKLLALLVLLGLMGSLFYLAFRIGTLPSARKSFRQEVESMRPVKALVADEDVSRYVRVEALIKEPLRIGSVTNENWMFVPEARAWCVDCKRPIPVAIVTNLGTCTFCNGKQPHATIDTDLYDGDGDGIPDKKEREYGMNPADKSDITKDLDGDGFDNGTEIAAGTKPNDANDHPSWVYRLKVDRLEATPFGFLFKSKIKMEDGSYKFGLNTMRGQTYFARMNDMESELYKKEGFLIVKYDEKFVVSDGGGFKMNVDVSVLTLKKGVKTIDLQVGKNVVDNDVTAHLVFDLDNSRIEVKVDGEFKLRGMDYKVISVDTKAQTVRIRCLQDRSESLIKKTSAPLPTTEPAAKAREEALPKPEGDEFR